MLRHQTAGESHGQALVAIIEGVPSGLKIRGDMLARPRRIPFGCKGWQDAGKPDRHTDCEQGLGELAEGDGAVRRG